MSSYKILIDLMEAVELEARAVRVLAQRLAEIGDVETGRDESAQADKAYQKNLCG